MNVLFKSSLIILLSAGCWAGINPTPLVPVKDPATQRDFQDVYQNINQLPTVTVSTNPPAVAPKKVGDEFVDKTNGKIYFATATVNSASWLVVN